MINKSMLNKLYEIGSISFGEIKKNNFNYNIPYVNKFKEIELLVNDIIQDIKEKEEEESN